MQRSNIIKYKEYKYYTMVGYCGGYRSLTLKAMLHEAIFLATCTATMTNKKPIKLQRGYGVTLLQLFSNLQRVQTRWLKSPASKDDF